MINQFHFRYKKQYKTKNKKQKTLCSQILQTNSWRIFAKAIVCNILWIREHLYLSLFQPVNLLKKIFWCKHFLVNFIKNTTTEFYEAPINGLFLPMANTCLKLLLVAVFYLFGQSKICQILQAIPNIFKKYQILHLLHKQQTLANLT